MEMECIRIACDMLREDVLPTFLDEKLREIDKLINIYGDGHLHSRQVIGLIVWQWRNEQAIRQALKGK